MTIKHTRLLAVALLAPVAAGPVWAADCPAVTVADPMGDTDTAMVTVTVLDRCAAQNQCPAWTDRVYTQPPPHRRLGYVAKELYPVCVHNKHSDLVETTCATLEDIDNSMKYDPYVEFLACGCCAAEKHRPVWC